MIAATFEDFDNLVFKVKCKVTLNRGVECCLWIFEAPLWVTHYINDARFPRLDGTHGMLKTLSVRDPKVKVVQMIYEKTPRDLTSQIPIAVEVLQKSTMEKSFPELSD